MSRLHTCHNCSQFCFKNCLKRVEQGSRSRHKNTATAGEKKEEEEKEEIIFAKDAVINLPGYICRVLHPEDEFVLVASDGLWDVLQPNECVRLVRFYISGEKELTLDQVAAKVVDAAVQRGTPDNTTLLIVRVN